MKKSTYVIAGLVVGLFVAVPSAGATTTDDCEGDATAEICNTGPNSTNTINQHDKQECEVRNNNKIYIKNTNTQIGTTGTASNSGNTNGGDAESGDADNSNEVKFTGVVSNGTCAPVVAQNPTPTPTPSGGNGGGSVESASTAAAPQVNAPVGGVAAGTGSTDRTGLLVTLIAASTAAVGFGLRRLQRQE